MNHGLRATYIMSEQEMLTPKPYIVEVTSNEGETKQYRTDCYNNAVYEVMCVMSPLVHMIVIRDADGTGGHQRWDREREVWGNDWSECDVDELITLGPIREVVYAGTIDGEGRVTSNPFASKNTKKHHWWGLARHMQRYLHFTETDPDEIKLDNTALVMRLKECIALVSAFAEIADYKITKEQKPKLDFIRAGKQSKLYLYQIKHYTESDHSADSELESLVKNLDKVVDSIYSADKNGVVSDNTRSQSFSLVWACVKNQWLDLVRF